jgi:hypothetical protein
MTITREGRSVSHEYIHVEGRITYLDAVDSRNGIRYNEEGGGRKDARILLEIPRERNNIITTSCRKHL